MPSRSALEVFLQNKPSLTIAEWHEIVEQRAQQLQPVMDEFGTSRLDSIKPLYGTGSEKSLASIFAGVPKPEEVFGTRGIFGFRVDHEPFKETEVITRRGWGLTRRGWLSVSVDVGRNTYTGEYVSGLAGVRAEPSTLTAITNDYRGWAYQVYMRLSEEVRNWEKMYRSKLDKISRVLMDMHADDKAARIYNHDT